MKLKTALSHLLQGQDTKMCEISNSLILLPEAKLHAAEVHSFLGVSAANHHVNSTEIKGFQPHVIGV